MQYKLQNVLLEDNQRTRDYMSMYVRTWTPLLFGENGSLVMPPYAQYEFSTYFGSLSIRKWERYADVDNFHLRLRMKGTFEVRLLAYVNDREYNISARSTTAKYKCSSDEMKDFDFELPDNGEDVVAFEITTFGDECIMEEAWYWTELDESRMRDIELNLVSPTYKKESYVLDNIELFRSFFASEEEAAKHFTVTIVDNGRSLPEGANAGLEDKVRIYPNINAGGAGGFARGMIEAIKREDKPTHILVMDDDVSVSLESFVRTYNLLRIVNDEYSKAFLSGAMISMQLQDHQVEDVGNIFLDATFGAIKPDRNLSDLNQIVANETVRFNRQRQYAAFWFCCFPVETIDEQGLPMPFFVRGDDAEYGLRTAGRRFMTLNGICVWHMSFGHSKFNCANECYLAIRNLLIISAITPSCKDVDVYNCLFKQNIESEFRKFNYDYCELMIDGVEDYLRGPEWLATTDPDSLMQSKFAKKPKYIKFENALPSEVGRLYFPGRPLNIQEKAKMKFTHNGHVGMNDSQMLDEPGSMLNEYGAYHESRLYMRKKMYYVNDDMETGYIAHIDRARYASLVKRLDEVEKMFYARKDAVASSWKAAHKYLTSIGFWEKYLGIEDGE